MTNNLDDELRKWGITASEKKVVLSRVTFTTDLTLAADCDLAIEAVPEDLALKQAVMLRLDAVCRPETVFVTSTSTLSVTEIAVASGAPTASSACTSCTRSRAARIVEIVRGSETSDATFDSKPRSRAREDAGIEVSSTLHTW